MHSRRVTGKSPRDYGKGSSGSVLFVTLGELVMDALCLGGFGLLLPARGGGMVSSLLGGCQLLLRGAGQADVVVFHGWLL